MVNQQDNATEIRLATKDFYRALNAIFIGDTSLMERVWSHANDVSYLGPQGGILIGWDQVLNAWKDHAMMRLGGSIESHEFHLIQEGVMAIMICIEIGTNYIEDIEEPIQIRAHNVFRKEEGKWKMICHHTDPLNHLNQIDLLH